jgi:hypothetical protein
MLFLFVVVGWLQIDWIDGMREEAADVMRDEDG